MKRVAVCVALAAALAGGCGSGPARCASPARLPGGQYSAYRTAGTMASGQAVRMADGDLWSCRDGKVTVS